MFKHSVQFPGKKMQKEGVLKVIFGIIIMVSSEIKPTLACNLRLIRTFDIIQSVHDCCQNRQIDQNQNNINDHQSE